MLATEKRDDTYLTCLKSIYVSFQLMPILECNWWNLWMTSLYDHINTSRLLCVCPQNYFLNGMRIKKWYHLVMKAVKAIERSLNEALYDIGETYTMLQSGGRIPTVFDFQQVTSMSLHNLWSH